MVDFMTFLMLKNLILDTKIIILSRSLLILWIFQLLQAAILKSKMATTKSEFLFASIKSPYLKIYT